MTERNETGEVLLRLLKAFFVHALLGAAAAAAAMFATAHFTDASQAVSDKFKGTEAADSGVRASLDLARTHLIGWVALATLVAFLASGLFIAAAQARRARNAGDGASRMSLWAALFFLTIAALGLSWWQLVSSSGVTTALASDSYLTALLVTIASVLLGYWLATGLAVTATMRASVPLCVLLPKGWN
jgi:ABC-type spermidine/putrescine transport system permease subunit I